ncbi:MAG: hypothetical protein H7175_21020, partial [Burkholderiales bacterium]|nr:hypothetical protein [Anaerolineae bacterium]
LALIRGRSTGLDELNEASVAVLCAGQTEPLALIRRKLIIGERMGSVPPDAPAVPLQRDLAAQQKRLRLKLSPDGISLDLDLRQPNDLARSQLFHRLNLLAIRWATIGENTVNAKGTFHEYWDLRWTPELDISTIEASIWGSTVEIATAAYARHQAGEAQQLSAVTQLLTAVLLAALPDTLDDLLRRLSDIASLTHDMHDLMAAAPPLVDTLRYGDVRGTDVSMVAPVLENVVLRVCIGLYRACINIDDDAAALLNAKILALESALNIAQNAELLKRWHGSLNTLANSDAAHPLLSGTAARLLFRASHLNAIDAARLMRLAFSVGNDAVYGARWLEGFMTGMEQLLVRDDALFRLIDEWVMSLEPALFENTLPLLRRTFSTFGAPAKRSLAEKVKRGERPQVTLVLDQERAERVLPIMRQILGI